MNRFESGSETLRVTPNPHQQKRLHGGLDTVPDFKELTFFFCYRLWHLAVARSFSIMRIEKWLRFINKVSSAALWLTALWPLSFFLLFNFYVFILNKTNHTGYDVMKAADYFSRLAVLAIFLLLISVVFNRAWVLPCLVLLGFSMLAAINIHYYDKTNMMVQYDEWGERGLPDRPYCIRFFPPGISADFCDSD